MNYLQLWTVMVLDICMEISRHINLIILLGLFIIAQVTTSTYTTSKEIDRLIKSYIPKKYSINSREEFLELLRRNPPNGLIASLDANSLFTNVPVLETIDMILDSIYNNTNDLTSLPIIRNTLKSILLPCTTEPPIQKPGWQIVLASRWYRHE